MGQPKPQMVNVNTMSLPSGNQQEMDAARAYVLQEQIGFILRLTNQYATGIFQSVFNEHAADTPITNMQFAVLVTLWDKPGISHGELSQITSLDLATLQGVVARLKEKGYVQIVYDEHDGRRRLVSLTEDGHSLASHLRGFGEEISTRTLAPLSSDEQTQLLHLLKKLIHLGMPERTSSTGMTEPDFTPQKLARKRS